MPRKSRDHILMLPLRRPGAGRPEPPPELDAVEAATWRQIVSALPAGAIGGADEHLLVQLCAAVAGSREVHRRLRAVRSRCALKELAGLAAVQLRESTAVLRLSHALRLTHSSRLRREAAANMRRQAKTSRPWLLEP